MCAIEEITIRRASRDDAGEIHRLIIELAAATGLAGKVTSTPEDFLTHGFGEAPAFEAILAERAGTTVGMAVFFFTFSTWRGQPGLYLQDLVVSESARGQGLGKRLLAETARAAVASGATHIRLSVDAANAQGMRFYESCGLDACTDERLYMITQPGLDELATAG